jgi:hypothetical protein
MDGKTEIVKNPHVVSIELVEEDRAQCQRMIIGQYDNHKIDEKKLAEKLRDLRKYSDTAKDVVGRMRELADVI